MLFLCCDKNVHKMISNNTGIKRVPHVHQLTSPSAVIPHSGLPCCETVFKSVIMKAHMYELSCSLQRIASDIALSFAFSMLERANNSILKVQSISFGTNSPSINFEKTARCRYICRWTNKLHYLLFVCIQYVHKLIENLAMCREGHIQTI